MPTCLITGCGGFIGSHLAELLLSDGCRVVGTVHKETRQFIHLADRLGILKCDITDRLALTDFVRETKPNFIFHLAGRNLIQTSWEDPEETFRTNVLGTLALLEAVREARIDPVLQIAGSSSEYGPSRPDEIPIAETREPRPMSPYAASKTAAMHLGRLYAAKYELRVQFVRPFQFIGPRKYPDACSEFARGIIDIERGRSSELYVGNIEAVRDLLDVRDGVKAMWVVGRSGQMGEIYNVCFGVGYRIREVLERLIALSGVEPRVREDRTKFRPLDEPIIVGDNKKLRLLGWRPEIPFDETLMGILEYWRNALD